MFKFGLPLAILLASAAPVLAQTPPTVKPATKALHESLIVLDTHFDTPANQAVDGFDIRKRNGVQDGSQVFLPNVLDQTTLWITTPQGGR